MNPKETEPAEDKKYNEKKEVGVTLPVVEVSAASDKTTTVAGINEGKNPKYDRKGFED